MRDASLSPSPDSSSGVIVAVVAKWEGVGGLGGKFSLSAEGSGDTPGLTSNVDRLSRRGRPVSTGAWSSVSKAGIVKPVPKGEKKDDRDRNKRCC